VKSDSSEKNKGAFWVSFSEAYQSDVIAEYKRLDLFQRKVLQNHNMASSARADESMFTDPAGL
jgi:hypothetical protein